MHIVFHCVTDTALATPLKLEHVMSAKKHATCCSDITRNIQMHKKIYKKQLFMGTIF